MGDELVWQKIAEIVKGVSPAIYGSFNPPVDSGAIDKFERKLGVQLPDSFKAYLRTFNGQKPRGLPLCGYNRLLPINQIVQTRKMRIELFSDEPPIAFLEENKIQTTLWDKLWIPFADFEGSNSLVLDLHAGKNGKDGQIILLYSGIDMESDDVVIAPSFSAFGEEFLRRLENGA
ncbi:MAG: SMI1/KNR4 family protein, partial [Helicobacteraceae bacterium]|nr:SMI1/KNR4 family protein [Helicobacteraceae bacterium]